MQIVLLMDSICSNRCFTLWLLVVDEREDPAHAAAAIVFAERLISHLFFSWFNLSKSRDEYKIQIYLIDKFLFLKNYFSKIIIIFDLISFIQANKHYFLLIHVQM